MRKLLIGFGFILLLSLVACSNTNDANENNDELEMIAVDFQVPDTADVGETVELLSEVTYKEEPVTDAEVEFEIWLEGNEDNSEMIEAENHEDGSYTLDYTFEEAGVYEMYAHTTAKNMHNMPKKQITVGDPQKTDSNHHESSDDNAHGQFHQEGFNLHFSEPNHVMVDEKTLLVTHITLNEAPYNNLTVQYEIQFNDDDEKIEWVKADEKESGEYESDYTFTEAGNYTLTIHVQDDEDLHEHVEKEMTVHK